MWFGKERLDVELVDGPTDQGQTNHPSCDVFKNVNFQCCEGTLYNFESLNSNIVR